MITITTIIMISDNQNADSDNNVNNYEVIIVTTNALLLKILETQTLVG